MRARRDNPYEPHGLEVPRVGTSTGMRRWPEVVAALATAYYVTSALTLPFADDVWFGEMPLLALIQLPKAFLKSILHEPLISLISAAGWSQGSRSPDYMVTHPWAMGGMTAVPALAIITLLALLKRFPRRRMWVAAVLSSALLDAAVTFWFDYNSRLSLYSSTYL